MNTEITTAITDLCITFFAVVAALVLRKIGPQKSYHCQLWQRCFWAISIASLLGYINHFYDWTDIAHGVIWIFLFPPLFEATRCVLLLGLAARFGERRPSKPENNFFLIAEFILCLTAIILRFFIGAGSMLPYILFATVIAALSLYHYWVLAKNKVPEVICFFTGLCLTVPAIYCQYTRRGFLHLIWDFDHNGISHIFIILAVIIVACGGVLSLREEQCAELEE